MVAVGHGRVDGQQLENLSCTGPPQALHRLLSAGGRLLGQPYELFGAFTQCAQRLGAGQEHGADRRYRGDLIRDGRQT